ncbi:MAG: hypothetical protein GX762_04175 [Bacteroidales bacterium]|nr:hypothetical protein [Clostridiales bacterium]NLC49553.1 hypothetical protein [Bacteroidales bacterium]
MKNVRKELVWGIILLIIWLVIKILPTSLVLIAAIALIVIGLLPSNLHTKVKDSADNLMDKVNKKN